MENMKMRKQNSGFTLLETMVSMAVGIIVLAAMAMLFKTGMNSAMLVTQRAETQQNMRAAMDLMVKDISMAGAGMPTGGIQLPTGAKSSSSKYGCDQTTTCHVYNGVYPSPNFMYYILPGYQDGVEGNATVPAAPPPAFSDSIGVAYADFNPNYPLSSYNVTFVAGSSPLEATFTPPTGVTLPAINSNGFIQQGDLIMISGGSFTAVGEVSLVSSSGGIGSVTFANGDPLNINQSAAASGNMNQVATALGSGAGVAYRVYVVSYYLNVPPAGQTPRLMRQVNGLTPVPVADDIINLQFAFDNYNSTSGTLDANQPNPLGAGESPNNIQKINILVMGQSITNDGNSQNLYLATDVSASNMAYSNPY
jgi:type II secretory pathway pseudopilin PulG